MLGFGALSELPISALPVAAAPPSGFKSAWARNTNFTVGNMKKNVAGQKVGAQLVSATDGSVFTGAVTVYVTGDGGTQALGSVGSGICTHEGNGYHTYAPAQAETNYDLTAFTFIGTGAVAATVQAYNSFPQSTDNPANLPNSGALTNLDAAVSGRMATYTQPTGFLTATFPGTVASTTNITAGTITTATNVTTVNGLAAGVITATSIAADAITDAKVAADVTIASVTGAVGSVTGNVGGNVTGAVGSVAGNIGGNLIGNVGGSVNGGVAGLDTATIAQGVWDYTPLVAPIDDSLGFYIYGSYNLGISLNLTMNQVNAKVDDLPTAIEAADALLNRDMSLVSDTNARTPLNALRVLRNKVSLAGTALTVTKEDDTTSAWTAVATAAPGAAPISAIDPA